MPKQPNEGNLTAGERRALDAAWAGSPPAAGDLSQESPYEAVRDREEGAEGEDKRERQLRGLDGPVRQEDEAGNHEQ